MALKKLIEEADDDGALDELKPGTKLLHGQYTIVRYLNSGGFGITYLAKDSLDRDVVIKECYADAFCRRTNTVVSARSRAHQGELKSIIRHFVQEAQSLSKLVHPNIVGVHQVFDDNDTAYMAIDYVEGQDLLEILEDPKKKFDPDHVVAMTRKLLGAVGFIHEHSLLHRDISPDNILIDAAGEPILIDFGAARENLAMSNKKHSALRVVKDGYSPQEFYIAGSDQGPWSDLYALAASLYHAITGQPPINGQNRLVAIAEQRPDPYEPLTGKIKGYPAGFLEAIDKALITMPAKRIQSAREWLDILDGTVPANSDVPAKAKAGKKSSKPSQKAGAAAPATVMPKVQRKTLMMAGSALAVVAVLGLLGYNNYTNNQAAIAAEQAESARIAAEAETARLAAEAETARIAAEAEAARLAAEGGAVRVPEAAEAARIAAEAEAARVAEAAEAARIAAEAETARLAAEAEAARIAAEAEVARIAAEAETARIAAEADLISMALQAETASLAAEMQAARLAAEQEAARIAAEAEAEANRLAAEEAARIAALQDSERAAAEAAEALALAQAETARQAEEAEAKRIADEEAAAAQRAEEAEAGRRAAEAEAGRRAAEEEALRQAEAAQQEAARRAAEQSAQPTPAPQTAGAVVDAPVVAQSQGSDVQDATAVMSVTSALLPFSASSAEIVLKNSVLGPER